MSETQVEETIENPVEETTEVTPPPVQDPWGHLTPEEKVAREVAWQQSQRQPEPPQEPSTHPFEDDDYARGIYQKATQDAEERAFKRFQNQYGGIIGASGMGVAMGKLTSGMSATEASEMQALMDEISKGESPETVVALADHPGLSSALKDAAKARAAAKNPQASAPAERTKPSTPQDDVKAYKAYYLENYGVEIDDEEAKWAMNETKKRSER